MLSRGLNGTAFCLPLNRVSVLTPSEKPLGSSATPASPALEACGPQESVLSVPLAGESQEVSVDELAHSGALERTPRFLLRLTLIREVHTHADQKRK